MSTSINYMRIMANCWVSYSKEAAQKTAIQLLGNDKRMHSMSMHKKVQKKLIECTQCNSKDISEHKHALICKKCNAFALKCAYNTVFRDLSATSKNQNLAHRTAVLWAYLKSAGGRELIGNKERKNRIRAYAFTKQERKLIRFMRLNYSTRKEKLQYMNNMTHKVLSEKQLYKQNNFILQAE